MADKDNPEGAAVFFDASLPGTVLPRLFDGDIVNVPSRESYVPVIYFEGAIATGTEEAKQYATDRQPFKPGDRLARSLKAVAPRLAPTADLRRAFITRKSQADTIPVDLEKLLYAYDPKDDVELQAEDRIFIPFGNLDVFVTGEVTKSAWVNTAALTRLSAAVGPLLTKYSSLRDIAIRNEGGEEKRYDLFLAERDGDREQDPFLKPGDTITVSRLLRSVAIAGEVKRPGTYQLLPGEGISELVTRYGEGLTREARPDFASLVKKANEQNPDGAALFFDATKLSAKDLPPLSDGDAISIPSRESYLPVIYFEGAIAAGTETAKQYATDRQPFKPGDRLARSLKAVAPRLAPTADLRRAFIARKSQADTIPVNLEKLLYAYDPKDDIELQAEDRIVIPFGSLDVFVTGEVTKSAWVNTAALTRLSSAVGPLLTKYSSVRDIAVRNEGGEEKRYDLFRAERDGDREQDPFLKPGDLITVGRLERSVTIGGEVKRPGTYQLLKGEGIAELVSRYSEGLTREARGDLASLVKKANDKNPDGGAQFFDATKLDQARLLLVSDGDAVTIPSRESYLPVIYFEGAIAAGTEEAKQYATDRQPFKPGDRLARSLKAVASRLAPTADLRRAFIARKSQADTIPVDLEKLLYAYDPKDDIELQAEDRIVIPFGNLDVFVTGEVTKSAWVNTAALTRLSSAVGPLLTKYSSVRDIAIRNEGGEEKRYDLFRAERDGDREQDPFLKPGDVVTVSRLTRSVILGGEVNRPGTYQLLAGEGIPELVTRYGMGLTREARPDYASLVKKANEQNPDGGALFFDATKLSDAGVPPLSDGDAVSIPSRESYLPVIYFEGAIAAGTEEAKQYATDRQPFKPGDRLARSLKAVAPRLAPTADLRRAFIARKSQADTIPVDLEKLLYAYDPKDDFELQAEDRIVIPFGNLDVFVTGEVTKSSWVNTAALTRLSSAVVPLLTKYSSLRDIAVRNEGGEEKRYDLFRAERDGDREQDPFLKPGDVVTVGRFERSVTIGGEIKRPGNYQLLQGEGIPELVSRYGMGLTKEARADYASVSRRANDDSPAGGALFFDALSKNSSALPNLSDGDVVYIPHRDSYLPIIYYEGAIAAGTEAGKQYNLDRQPFRPGDKLSRSLREVAKKLSPNADLKRAFIARKGSGEKIPVDLERILYAYTPEIDVELAAEDRIVIPFGNMDVFITGEVTKSSWVGTGVLTRLSAAVAPLLTRYSSNRDILVKSADGGEKRFDLFRAERYGDLEQDPYLLSGDVVTIERFQVVFTVAGEVRRPGTYQLLPGEGLTEVIEIYAGGFTDQANTARIALTRSPFTGFGLGQMQYLDYANSKVLPVLCYDSFSVPSLVALRPVVYFEGAINTAENVQALDASRRLPYQFVPGEMLSYAAHVVRKGFSAESDLANAYVVRGGRRIPANIADFIYNKDFSKDVELASGDVVVVPFRQFFVSVSGAV
ncbi:MAG: SLBB domain-containing protein, partial [Spirochaetaceae bacterium]|nr:SLBB domain-containing protein [Spirochaetaceae bacterium]